MKKQVLTVSIIFALLFNLTVQAQKDTNERSKWFTDARYGMFIHWGVYSGAEGFWRGEKLRYDNNYAEWLYYRNRLNKDDYLTLLDRFNWDEIDPEEWVVLAKEAGMKYITFTAKHHDGFALWDSKIGTYDIGDQLNHTRDIVKELAEACKKHDMKLGLYYSHWLDWNHPQGWDYTKKFTGLTNEEYDIYWQEKVIPQITELLTNYGDICMLWFDMWIHHSEAIISKEQLLQLKSTIRELQPNCLVNSRLGLDIQEDPDVDYKTLLDNELGDKKEDFPWQSPATVAHSWGINRRDTEWKSTSTLIHSIINNVSLNGNFMLNIGPRANGDVQYGVRQRLLETGEWLTINGEAIYGAEAFELRKDIHDWGKITCKKTNDGGKKLYLHVLSWPLDNQIKLTGVNSRPEKIYLLSDKHQKELDFEHKEVVTTIDLPVLAPDNYCSVVVVEYKSEPEVTNGLIAASLDKGYSMTPMNSGKEDQDNIVIPDEVFYGSIPTYAKIDKNDSYSWRVYVEQPDTLNFIASYSYQGKKGKSQLQVTCADQKIEKTIEPTGKMIYEPQNNTIIDEFMQVNLGEVVITKSGYYTIDLQFQPGKREEVKFHYLWIE